jgi:release factor glutamine methyltransferase
VGTGSGIISICAAKSIVDSRVTAIDISPAALAVAAANATEHKVSDTIELVESDLFAVIPSGRRFDFVVSNPPYISNDEMRCLPVDVKDHEPAVALAAGAGGTDVIARLIPQAADRLLPGGWLILEISPMIHESVRKLFADDGRFEVGPTVKDVAGHSRVMQARRNPDQ